MLIVHMLLKLFLSVSKERKELFFLDHPLNRESIPESRQTLIFPLKLCSYKRLFASIKANNTPIIIMASDNRGHLALFDQSWWAIRRENSQNQPANGGSRIQGRRMWWLWTKAPGIRHAADISGTQTRIKFQFALLFLSSSLYQQLGSSKREIKGGRWTVILRQGFVWNGTNTKPEGWFWSVAEADGQASCSGYMPPGQKASTAQQQWGKLQCTGVYSCTTHMKHVNNNSRSSKYNQIL